MEVVKTLGLTWRVNVGYLIVYVDDIVLATNCIRIKLLLESTLEKEYKLTKLREVKSIRGMNITMQDNLGLFLLYTSEVIFLLCVLILLNPSTVKMSNYLNAIMN